MKKIFFLLLFTNFLYAQEYNHIKKCDTIYIIYKGKEFERKSTATRKDNRTQKIYRFLSLPKKDTGCMFYYVSQTNDSLSSTNVDEEFIDKHKNNIVSVDFFLKLKDCFSCEFIFSVNNKKTIFYIIDFTEEKNHKIPIYKVRSMKLCPIKE